MLKMNYQDILDYDVASMMLEHLTVTRTVHYLTYIFDSATHEIYVNGTTTTPIELAHDPKMRGLLASRVPIRFWGGPPDEEEWYDGSLLAMLMDKLFYCVALHYYDVIDRFFYTLNGYDSRNKA
jgi:hypothetical protein